jgi:hypothetical protein
MGVIEERSEPLSFRRPPAFQIDVLLDDLVPCAGAPLAELAELVLGILTFVIGRYSGVNRNSHGCSSQTLVAPYYGGLMVPYFPLTLALREPHSMRVC